MSHGFNGFDIYLLNEKHTKKERIMSLKSELNSQKAIDFIILNTKLKHEVYNPDFLTRYLSV